MLMLLGQQADRRLPGRAVRPRVDIGHELLARLLHASHAQNNTARTPATSGPSP
jgi:hypothetical protein